MSFEYKDNSKEVLSAIEKAKKNALNAIGLAAVSHATDLTPAVTGLLKNSITYALAGEETKIKKYKADVAGKNGEIKTGSYSGTAPPDKEGSVYIGSNVEYCEYIELGGSGRTAFHMLQRAATKHTAEYKKLMEESMKNA